MRTKAVVRALIVALGLLACVVAGAQQGTAPAPTSPPPSPVIARVEGRPITQEDFDRVAGPYFDRLRGEMKQGFTDDVKKMASKNVIDELIRREALIVQAQREKLTVTEAETDRILKQDTFFYTNGQFDQNKFIQYKMNPQTNYLTVLPRIRELAMAGKMDSLARVRVAPSSAAVRSEWEKRNDQVRFKFIYLGLRDISLEPEATESEVEAYYAGHPDQFQHKARIRLGYVRLPVPEEGNGQRDSLSKLAMARARGLADSLKRGIPIDTLGTYLDGVVDTGPFEIPPQSIPGLGRSPELEARLAQAETDTTFKVVGPVLASDAVVVGVITERHSKFVPPLAEILPDVKRRADAEKRSAAMEASKRAWYDSHHDQYRNSRAHVTRVLLAPEAVSAKSPSRSEVEKWYAKQGRVLGSLPDSVPLPALNDSLRELAHEWLVNESQQTEASARLQTVATGWRAGKDVRSLARTARAAAETLWIARRAGNDSIFLGTTVDSFFVQGTGVIGRIEGPRLFGATAAVWRVDQIDSTYVPPFESVRPRVESEVAADKRATEEADGNAWFQAHQTEYKTKPKYVIDYIKSSIPPIDSIRIPDADLRKSYEKNRENYRQEEQVRARHILIGTRGGQITDAKARARADSLRGAILRGADFADLAQRFSDDPGSGSQGGDLGFFARGRMVREFSDTSFALPVGRVSQPVKTQFGYHLIRVDEKKPAGIQPFDEVKEDIRRTLAQARGDSSARLAAQKMRRRLGNGEAAAVVAAGHGGVATSVPFAANEPIAGLGQVPGIAQQLDSLKAGRWAAKPIRGGDGYLVVRLKEKIPAGQASFADVRQQAIDDAKTAKKKEILAGKVTRIRGQLAAHASFDSLALHNGGLKDSGPLAQMSPFVPYLGAEPRVVAKSFAMKVGAVSDTLHTSQGVSWIRVEEHKPKEGTSFAKDKPAIVQELQQKKYDEWLEAKKKSMKIDILRADLREKPKPLTQTFTVGG